MVKRILSCLLPLLLCSAVAGHGASSRQQIAAYLAAENFWISEKWLRLLHFPPGQKPLVSRVDGGDFFISPHGSRDPVAEGEAFLKVLYQDQELLKEELPLACLYPARYRRLVEALTGTGLSLPQFSCPNLSSWLDALQVRGVSLVFPEAYLNNPASMFGHSLLRFSSSRYRSPLLSPSLGYAAEAEEERGFDYAFKGIFGGYEGHFNLGWYGDMVRRYGAIENRDIWEYRLAFNAAETEFLLLHFYELKRASFRYYFFDENCSGQLLSLFFAVRPDLSSHLRPSPWQMPLEMVAFFLEQGLVEDISYRPSLRYLLQKKERRLDPAAVKLAAKLCRSPQAEWPIDLDGGDVDVNVLELALDCRYYHQMRRDGREDTSEAEVASLLKARRRLAEIDKRGGDCIKEQGLAPGQGHSPARLQLAAGSLAGEHYWEIGLRPALHDLLDPQTGYSQGSRLEVFDTRLRYFPETAEVELDQLQLIDIVSVPAITTMVKPISWSFGLGARQFDYGGLGRRLTAELKGAAGYSLAPVPGSLLYAMTGIQLIASDQLNGAVDLAPGLVGGMRLQKTPQWSAFVEAEGWRYLVEQKDTGYQARARVAYHFAKDRSFLLELSQKRDFGKSKTSFAIGFLYYF